MLGVTQPLESENDDGAILEIARRTSDRMGLQGSNPARLSWQMMLNPGRRGASPITPHFPVLQGSLLILSEILKGRVTPEEWGPVIASSLVYYRKLRRAYKIGTILRILPGIIFMIAFLAFGFAFFPTPSGVLIGWFIAVVIALIVAGSYSSLRLNRKLVLKADREASEAIGTASLIESLKRLEALRESDTSRGEYWPEYGDHPSILKRIANLETIAGKLS